MEHQEYISKEQKQLRSKEIRKKRINKFLKNRLSVLGFIMTCLIVIACFICPILSKQTYDAVNIAESASAPSMEHIFGTDKLGRDVLSRVIYGTRISLSASLILVVLIFLIGTIAGILAGYFGGIVNAVIMRISDMMISFPGMVLAIAMAGIMGASVKNAVIAIMLVSWTKYARLARSLVLKICEEDYIYAARVTGCKTSTIIVKYLLPNILPTLVITATTDIGTMILELAGLSFLGFGAQSPAAEWGLMLNEGRAYLLNCPWLMIAPGIAICIVVIVFNLIGDKLRDILDVRQEASESQVS